MDKPKPAKYYYQGKQVEPIEGQKFDSHWNVKTTYEVDGKSYPRTISVPPGQLQTTPIDVPIIGTPTSGQLLNINQASFTDLRQNLPGVGRTSANKIVQNKPETGYSSLEQLKEINSALKVNWETIADKISFA
jgi:DNA uptake protein ComE-like DNA-binding protein